MISSLFIGVGSLLLAAGAPQAGIDPIAERLEKIKSDFEAKDKVLREEMLKLLQAAEKKATKLGDKATADRLVQEETEFKKNRVLPRSLSAPEVRKKMENARLAVFSAYRKAISEYTKKRKKKEADAVEKEMADFDSHTPSADLESEAFVKGSVWEGEIVGSLGGRFGSSLTVHERTGNTFRATFEILGRGNAHHVREVRGTIERNFIKWSADDVKVVEGHAGQNHWGTVTGDKITMEYKGPARAAEKKGQTVSGKVTLTRK